MIANCIVLLAALASITAVEVSTTLGGIRGVQLKSRLGKDFYAFRGIRYAKPPVEELRFKNPKPVDAWKPEIFDATKDGPECPQKSVSGSEDCLCLNVYSKDLNVTAFRPVLIYIHPGGFYGMSGNSGSYAGPEYFMDRDIVLVTINYRLGTLGFLATGTAHAPGNAGLKDQVLAFKWVRDHIRNFGGDPQSVTLMGYCAGSLSVGLHMVSPMSEGLFHRGIAMSASPIAQWKYSTDQLDLAKKQAGLVNCPTNTIDDMMKCLQKTPADEFSWSFDKMFEIGYTPILNWLPVIERNFGQERFLTGDPVVAFQNGRFHKVPLIVGMTKDGFMWIPYYSLNHEATTQKLNDEWDTMTPISLMYERNTPKSKNISAVLRKEYLDDKPLSDTGPFEPLGRLYSDGAVGFGIHRFAHLAARYVSVHYYVFSYKGRVSNFKYPRNETYGAVQFDDTLYLFHMALTTMYTQTDPEDKTVERLTRMWTKFAKTGDPNDPTDEFLEELDWQPLDLKKENYLDIGDELVMKNGLFLDRFAIWSKLFPLNWCEEFKQNNSENLDYPEVVEPKKP